MEQQAIHGPSCSYSLIYSYWQTLEWRPLCPASAIISRPYYRGRIHALATNCTSKGNINKEVDEIVEMIDQLMLEKQTLLKQQQQTHVFSSTKPASLLQQQVSLDPGIGQLTLQVFESRVRRLGEIERMINSLEELFNKHTGSVDKVKVKRGKSGEDQDGSDRDSEGEDKGDSSPPVSMSELTSALAAV